MAFAISSFKYLVQTFRREAQLVHPFLATFHNVGHSECLGRGIAASSTFVESTRQPLCIGSNIDHWHGATSLKSGDQFEKKGRGRFPLLFEVVASGFVALEDAVSRNAADVQSSFSISDKRVEKRLPHRRFPIAFER
jgi:hypothetical protein